MLKSDITPVVLTANEEANIGRCLSGLMWAERVIVLDSGSVDKTLEIAQGFPNVSVYTRAFDCHANQWNFGISKTDISTAWILALDADYVANREFVDELLRLVSYNSVDCVKVRFSYAVFGRILRCGIYPPVIAAFRTGQFCYEQDGHTQRLRVGGSRVGELTARLVHDDRKSLSCWFKAQVRYAELEALREYARCGGVAGIIKQAIRSSLVLSSPAVFFYVYILRGGILDGRYGLYYALQRAFAEVIRALVMLDRALRGSK